MCTALMILLLSSLGVLMLSICLTRVSVSLLLVEIRIIVAGIVCIVCFGRVVGVLCTRVLLLVWIMRIWFRRVRILLNGVVVHGSRHRVQEYNLGR
jgi:hypothetical protein